ncbi:MAG: ATP-binding protein [Bacteroidia bacterium]|nr:ATP-binding protein [Bacteroidia bacterium]
MLLEFSVANFLSIKERLTLSLEAGGISEYPENTFTLFRGKSDSQTLLRSAVLYGANGSGKSNVLKAISVMDYFIRQSARMGSTDQFEELTPYLLSPETEQAPSFFEIVFFHEGYRYRYGFELTRDRVHTEWLFRSQVKAEKMLFIRDGEAIELGAAFKEGERLEEKTRPNGLFLAVVDQFNGEIAKSIMAWFRRLNSISGLKHEPYRVGAFRLLKDPTHRKALLSFIDRLDLGFDEVQVLEEAFDASHLPSDLPPELRKQVLEKLKDGISLEFRTRHHRYDERGQRVGEVYFDLDEQESSGTRKLFDLLGPFFDTLLHGGALVADELDAKLHPLLTKALVDLFHSPETNPKQAQLIFATHDTNLLSYGCFRRDQIYFTEKNRQGATDLYSLLEYREEGETIRKDRSFEKDYIEGRYGAIPYLGNLNELFRSWPSEQKSVTA